MAISRFSRTQPQRGYQELSFQELAYAPTQMRQREDALMNARDTMLNDMNNYTGIDQYGEEAEAVKNQMRERVDTLSSKIKEHGAGNLHYIDDFRSFRNDYNQAVSKTGVLGMSSAIKNSIDQAKTAYYDDAQKKNLPAEAIARGWAGELQKYKGQLPSKLTGFKGNVPGFNPNMAPDKIDFADKAIKYNSLMGMIKKQYPGSEMKMDENGEYQLYRTNGTIVSNDENLAYFKNLMATEIQDPNSDMRRYADYIGMDPKDMMRKFDMIGGVMRKHQETQSAPQQVGGKKSTEKARFNGDVTNLRATQNASAEIPNSYDSQSIKSEYARIDRDTELNEEDKQAALNSLLVSYNNREKIESDEGFLNNMNDVIQNSEDPNMKILREQYGVNSWSDYQKVINDPVMNTPVRTGYTSKKDGGSLEKTMLPLNKVKALMEPYYEKEVGSKKYNHLTNSEQFTLGTGGSDDDSRKVLNSAVSNPERMESLLMSGAIAVQEEGTMNFTNVPADPNDDKATSFLSNVQQALNGNGKVKFGAINSGNMLSAPELQYSITNGDGKTTRFKIDLGKDSELAAEVFDEDAPFFKNLSPSGKNTVRAMRENMEYRGLDVAINESEDRFDYKRDNERFSDKQTSNIRRYANQRDQEAFGFIPQSSEDPNSRDAYAYKNRFFSTDDPDVKFNVEMNEDNSYSSYKKNQRTGEMTPFTFKDYLDKEFASTYLQNNAKNPKQYPMTFLNDPKAEQMKMNHYIDYMVKLVENTGDLDNPDKSMIAYGSGQSFKKAINDIYQLRDQVRNGAISKEKAYSEYEKAFKMIENKTVRSKRPKLIL